MGASASAATGATEVVTEKNEVKKDDTLAIKPVAQKEDAKARTLLRKSESMHIADTLQENVLIDRDRELKDIRNKILLLDFETFRSCGSYPRQGSEYQAWQQGLIPSSSVDTSNSVIIFVSHCWLRGSPSSEGYSGSPHPDNASNDKYRLTVQGVELIWKHLAPHCKQCYLWIDFACMNQDADPAGELRYLDHIVRVCDCIFTPIVDPDPTWELPAIIRDWYTDYQSPAWNGGKYAYINRAWCRLEMFYAANIPLYDHVDVPSRMDLFESGFRFHLNNGVRPHVIYGDYEKSRQKEPTVLPPLRNSYFEKYNPSHGCVSHEKDLEHIGHLVDALRPHMSTAELETYVGAYDTSGKKTGFGTWTMGNGNVYTGHFESGLFHGKGRIQGASGNYYEGDFVKDVKHGIGKYVLAAGECYEGSYEDNERSGHGVLTLPDHTTYDGQWKHNKRHGHGTLTYTDPDTGEKQVLYSGDWIDDVQTIGQ